MPNKSKIEELKEIELELEQDLENAYNKDKGLTNPVEGHYVNNKELLEEFKKYRVKYLKWKEEGENGPRPQFSNKIATAIINIAHKRCNSWQFVNYTIDWKEEMIDDAIEICVRYVHNFDPNKSNNPFAYITQLVNNALKQRIKIEQKNLYIKAKAFDDMRGYNGEGEGDDIEVFNETDDIYRDKLDFISEYEEKNDLNKKRKKKKKSNQVNILDELDDDNE